MTRIAELMSSPVVSCRGDTSLGDVAALLAERRIHGAVVVDDGERPVGVVADTDLLAGEWLATDEERLEAMRSLTARDVMSSPPVTIDADSEIGEAAALMLEQGLARLVVTRDGRAAGVLATSDLVRNLARGAIGRRSVADAMSRGLVVCREDATAREAARAMTERRSRSLVVVAPDGRPLGIVTGTDLLALLDGDPDSVTVAALMQAPVTITPDEPLHAAADRLLEHEIHRLVVVDPDEPESMPLGILSTADLVAEMASPDSVWRAER